MAQVTMGRAVLVIASAVLVVAACGSEPKKEPIAATASPSEPPPSVTTSEAGAPAATADAGGSVTAAKPDKAAECTAWVDDAQSTLDAERIAVDKVCKKDADCIAIKGRACAFNCANGAIPKVEEKGWNEAVTKVKDGACKKWTDNECSKLNTKPPPTCQDRKVWCDKGHCALKEK